jgi:hypothetical protein
VSRRVFDCFPFGSELDVLRLRLELLDPVVDRFVLVEAPTTFSGVAKPLHYAEHRDDLTKWADKIEHVVVDDMPLPDPTTGDRWVPERFQRQALARGLADAAPDDLVLVSDVDELIDPEVVAGPLQAVDEPVALEMRLAYLRANWERPGGWDRARACSARHVGDPHELRCSDPRTAIRNAGAHLSYLSDVEGVARKLAGAAHDEFDRDTYRDPDYLEVCMLAAVLPLNGRPLDVRRPDELSAVQQAVLASRPDLFDFEVADLGRWRPLIERYLLVRQRRRFPTTLRHRVDARVRRFLESRRARPTTGR